MAAAARAEERGAGAEARAATRSQMQTTEGTRGFKLDDTAAVPWYEQRDNMS